MKFPRVAAGICLTSIVPGLASAGMLETETARLRPQGGIKLGAAFEYQTSSDGKEYALPLEFEAGLTDNLELLVEPVAYTSIRPKNSPHASGFGDTETTLIWRFVDEDGWRPAMAVAGEIKFPTARNSMIGTRKTDYTGFVIASKHFGHLDTHFNLGYTVYGQPDGAAASQVSNSLNLALAAVYTLDSGYQLFAEVLSNSLLGTESPEPGSSGTGGAVSSALQEASTGETSGTVGAARPIGKHLRASLGVSYDNNHAWMLRPGLEYSFP
jgi:hypothetical protein